MVRFNEYDDKAKSFKKKEIIIEIAKRDVM